MSFIIYLFIVYSGWCVLSGVRAVLLFSPGVGQLAAPMCGNVHILSVLWFWVCRVYYLLFIIIIYEGEL